MSNQLPVIGAVSYLNTKPLVAGLGDDQSGYRLEFDLPSRLAAKLSAGSIDVGLIPVVEAARNGNYTIISNACIACCGPVWSVKLLSQVAPDQIKTLSLDEGSRTSCALTKVWLHENYHVTPTCQPLAIEDDWRAVDSDAVLIIGDRAMNAEDQRFPFTWDLGQAWNDWTGKPFVFAVWAARKGVDLDHLSQLLSDSRDRGLSEIREIAEQHSPAYGLSLAEGLKYLQEHLHFSLGPNERTGMETFLWYASKLSLVPEIKTLEFHDFQTTG